MERDWRCPDNQIMQMSIDRPDPRGEQNPGPKWKHRYERIMWIVSTIDGVCRGVKNQWVQADSVDFATPTSPLLFFLLVAHFGRNGNDKYWSVLFISASPYCLLYTLTEFQMNAHGLPQLIYIFPQTLTSYWLQNIPGLRRYLHI